MPKMKIARIEDKIRNFAIVNAPYSNVIGLGRSIIALGTLLTLITNPIDNLLIKKTTGEFFLTELLKEDISTKFNFFLLFGSENLFIAKWLAIIILVVIISGYFQKITSILHWWITFSFFHSSAIIDGGDQIASILTLLLIPICLFDNRRNHWDHRVERESILNLISISFLFLLQLQMSIVYLHAAVGKFGHNEWANGTAIYYWLNHSYFGMSQYMNFFNVLLTNSYVVTFLTYGTLILELALFLALFAGKNYKLILLFIAIFFHFIIIFSLGIFSFFFAMAGGLILYLCPANIDLKFLLKK